MTAVNRVLLAGNLTRDPEVRYTREGRAVCRLGMAVNHHWRSRDGSDKEDVCFVDVEVFGALAERCGRYGRKGRSVLVEGHLRQKQWQDRRSGEPHSKLMVSAESLQFLRRDSPRQEP